ncbi:DUF3429 domain-containing protein [Psychromonas sp. MB-3u-54]|uniref:DUF3429 domain-containing protein n=1 Tax=Psychromonas sp. MB-3u-54 TaxID=2058319 RepID=UPI0012FED393|nr:DUF3429 domain-containing protein [Psychromonas sp. MB-3u-54]
MKTWQWLGYLGLIPFVACLLLFEIFTDSAANNYPFNPQQAFLFYSAIILSFLAGTLWRKDTLTPHIATQIISNILCLYAFICLFIPIFYALVLLPLGYFSLFFVEYFLCHNKEDAYTTSYYSMRLRLTVLVIFLHAAALMSWF